MDAFHCFSTSNASLLKVRYEDNKDNLNVFAWIYLHVCHLIDVIEKTDFGQWWLAIFCLLFYDKMILIWYLLKLGKNGRDADI